MRAKARRNGDAARVVKRSGKSNDVIRVLPADLEGSVIPVLEEPRVALAGAKDFPGDEKFHFYCGEMFQQRAGGCFGPVLASLFFDILEQFLAVLEVNGLAIVRIDQSEVPEFRSLVKIRNAGSGEFDGRLGE